MIDYTSIEALVKEAEKRNIKLSKLILEEQSKDLETTEEKIIAKMDFDLTVMENSVKNGMSKDTKSTSGLTGGDAYKLEEYSKKGSVSGDYTTKAMAAAMAVAEYNAAMGKIVACPTAGSCGILPGVVIPLLWSKKITREQAIEALITAGGIGIVIANVASIAGAEGGCQAECGSAAAMAAAALVELSGGTPTMAGNAVAIAIKNQLGLVCDPVAGLVEVPCIKRNTGSVMCAIGAAELALADIKSVIPVDEVILAMKQVGDAMHSDLKETAMGGLAASKTGKALKKKIFGTQPAKEE